MDNIILYHGSTQIIKFPEIRITKFNKDFYFGFYCTVLPEQAKRWAVRFTGAGILNECKISRAAFWELARFKKPTHQISFHTAKALTTLEFLKGYEVYD